jgi:7-carboxy-7-deazaguanine synthase
MNTTVNTEPILRINDVFWTLQGEGANWGRRALFVRMPFCNLTCSWCDTQFNSFKKWTYDEFLDVAQSEPSKFAVLTGGEPMMNKQSPEVVKLLKSMGFEIACETNGMFPIIDGIDFATISPKRDSEYFVHDNNFSKAAEFKYVVDEGFNFSVLDRHKDSHARLYLSTEFGNFEKSVQLIIAYIKENPRWRLSLQTHKWIKVP